MITMPNTLGAYLKREIQQRGLSQNAAAVKWDVPLTTLNGLVNDESVPSLPTLRKIADALSVSIVRLIELAGFAADAREEIETPGVLSALTDDDRAFIDSLSVEELRDFIDFARRQRERLSRPE